jgi:hypothetical protein
MPSSITTLNFNNEPFIRSLTAQAVGDQNRDLVTWLYPSFATAQTTAFNAFTTGTIGSALSARTLIFSFTSTTYDYRTTSYTLCTLPLTCINLTTPSTAVYSLSFDTFPNIDFKLFVNYENTNSSAYFYRLTSINPLTASPNLTPYFINLNSTSYNLTSALSSSQYNSWYSLNNSSTRLTNLTALTGFNRTPSTRLSSVQATLSSISAPGSLSAWYTPHILQRSLSAVFVPYFLSGDFIGYPRGYINSARTFNVLTPATLNDTPGMLFYGEGHTETIILSSIVDSRATRNVWRLDNSVTKYPLSAANLSQPLLTAFVTLTSLTGTNEIIPVSLHVTNSLFLSTDPFYYYDDITGNITPYPYYISTTDSNGNELTPRNKLKESIQIKIYDPTQFIFNPGISSKIYLPVNGSQISYQASLLNNIVAPNALSACFGKYGLIWNWASFAGTDGQPCSANPSSFSGEPSSWLTVACSGLFPKQWTLTDIGVLSTFNTNPATYSAISMIWTISSEPTDTVNSFYHMHSDVTPTSANYYKFNLSLLDYGGQENLPDTLIPDDTDSFSYTCSRFGDTNITINARQTIRSQISALFTANALALGYTNDWQVKDTTFDQSFSAISYAPPQAKIYTPNRFVLTGTNVNFESLFTGIDLLSVVKVDFDDSKTILLVGSDISRSFSTTYDIVGFKTLRISMYTNYEVNPIVTTFPNIIQVLTEYDQVSPTEYRSTLDPIILPWSQTPHVGSNDWVVEDNINNWFAKFFDNLNYLESRGRSYPGTFSDYFGYLGVSPTTVGPVTACATWTWQDLDCFNTSLPYEVTWRDVLSAEDPFDESGKFVQQGCSTWKTYECTSRQINPTCYGLYDVAWSWRQRKRGNSLTPITWKQTKFASNEYRKRWYYEPSQTQFLTVCNEGDWNVNIPGLDAYYEPIANPAVQLRCIYEGLASRNNVLYTAQKTQIKIFDSNRAATFVDYEDTIDGIVGFSDIKNICIDSVGKLYVLDGILSRVSVFTYEKDTPGDDFKQFVEWGGYGTAASQTAFSSPNDIHVDQLDNVWVTDTGNKCVKHYSNTGTWLKTIIDDELKENTPLSVAVDSQQNVHILTETGIRVYTYAGEFLFSYNFTDFTSASPRKINSSYNREVIYLALETQVLKFFRNGVFYGYIIKEKENVNNITGLYHDEFRNLLITTDDKILKYPDIMTIRRLKGTLPSNYWSLDDILIHKEEYVQNWVYTKSFQRMWDNIEIFRNTLLFDSTTCKGYKVPIHGKEKMIIGQNEIVTSTVVNRVLGYLWNNFNTLLDYFDPSCEEPL